MHELDDNALLRRYTEQNSEAAFASLVARHVDKVYSVAHRHTRNPHQAEEITQAVFVILAKKAEKLRHHTALSGWLYQTARLTAVTFIRGEIRRARREQEAHMQTLLNEPGPDAWPQIAPLLDTAMAGLNETDRHAVVLRYFDGRSLSEVGTALGASEDAAKKRVTRAVEKLRGFFTKRGIVLSATALTTAISENSVQAAPAVLAKTAAAVAFAKGATASGSTLTLIKGALKVMAWSKAKTAVVIGVAAVLVLGVGGKMAAQHLRPAAITPDNAVKRLRAADSQDYFPRSSWVSAGYADPKSTVMTSLWAVREGNGEKIMDCLTPSAREKAGPQLAEAARKEGKSVFAILARESAGMFSKNTGFKILNVATISDDTVAVHLIVPDDFRIEYAFLLKKIGSEWKIEEFRN
jgi:RNA polymerase sigma factor (sigma-70 family)